MYALQIVKTTLDALNSLNKENIQQVNDNSVATISVASDAGVFMEKDTEFIPARRQRIPFKLMDCSD